MYLHWTAVYDIFLPSASWYDNVILCVVIRPLTRFGNLSQVRLLYYLVLYIDLSRCKHRKIVMLVVQLHNPISTINCKVTVWLDWPC